MPAIPNGTPISLNGSTRTLDISQLKTLQFTPDGTFPTPPPLVPLSKIKTWQSGGGGFASWAPNAVPGGFSPQYNSLTGNFEIEVYPNGDAITSLPVAVGSPGDLYYIDPVDESFVIQPLLLNAAEQTALNETIAKQASIGNPQPQLANCRFISGAVMTAPACQSGASVFGFRVMLPAMQTGIWPAGWLLNAAGGWPPEIDVFEIVQQAGQPVQYTSSVHWTDQNGNNQGQTMVWKTQPAVDGGYHDIWADVAADFITIFYDGLSVGQLPMPSNFTKNAAGQWVSAPLIDVEWYAIMDYALAGAGNGWPGPLNPAVNVLPPMKTADVLAMTRTGSATPVVGYVPPKGAAPITFSGTPTPTPSPTAFAITSPLTGPLSGVVPIAGTSGSEWVNVAGFTLAGVTVVPDTTPKNGNWASSLDTTKQPNGPFAFTMNAFSMPPGGTGGTGTSLPVSVNINNTPTPPPDITITPAQLAAMQADLTAAQAGAVAAEAGATAAQTSVAAVQAILNGLK